MNTIPIAASSAFDACEQINTHLKKYLDDGWTGGKAFALVDGWKNQYELSKDSMNMTLEFDLRLSLPNFHDSMEFTINSLMLCQPGALQIMRNLRDEKPPYETKIWRGVLYRIVIGILVWYFWIRN
jgi:hypothetical protein